MVVGSFVVAFCLIVLGWTTEIVGLFVKDPEKVLHSRSSSYSAGIIETNGLWTGEECYYCLGGLKYLCRGFLYQRWYAEIFVSIH